jgi:hypothetical protein
MVFFVGRSSFVQKRNSSFLANSATQKLPGSPHRLPSRRHLRKDKVDHVIIHGIGNRTKSTGEGNSLPDAESPEIFKRRHIRGDVWIRWGATRRQGINAGYRPSVHGQFGNSDNDISAGQLYGSADVVAPSGGFGN